MSIPAPSDDALRNFATVAAGRDPEATVTARFHLEATLAAPVPAAITVPTLPRLAVAEDTRVEGADFEVAGVLGEGGMGRVLLARQKSLHRDVAVKVLKGSAAQQTTIDLLLAEAVVTGSLEHPNVVPVHALGLDAAGRPVLVMKRIEGVSFRDLAKNPGHPAWSALVEDAGDRLDAEIEILMAVCNAAHFAHSRGIVHRDIKLDNVMIGSFGEVYLVDWGIAVRASTPDLLSSQPGALVGTPAYMAPEMLNGAGARLDARTDVYLLGATLHALLTGQPRHRGESLYDLLLSARESSPYAYGPDVPAELAAICNRAMAKDPGDRFASALELRRALGAFRRHKGSIALSDEAAARLASITAADEQRAHAILTECRFGFTAALRAWPENPAALDGLAACLGRMIEHELAQRDLEGARALYAELRAPRPDLLARIEALAADVAAAAEREARLRALERDRDLSVGGGAQLAVVAVMPVIAVGFFVYLLRSGFAAPGVVQLVGLPALVFVALVAGRWLRRRHLHTEISRKALTLLALAPGIVTVHRLLAVLIGTPLPAIALGDLAIAAALVGALAVAVMPRFAWVIPAFAAAAAGIVLRPDRALPIFGLGTLAGMALVLVVWRRSVRG
jgi:serine/threonine-protein kinase